VGAIVAMGFTVLGLKIDIKIISMYDHNPWGISFMLILLIVGLLVGWKVETITTRRLVKDLEKYPRRE
jgi:Ni/Fe-hydrogenase subunit HybB-like protein